MYAICKVNENLGIDSALIQFLMISIYFNVVYSEIDNKVNVFFSKV